MAEPKKRLTSSRSGARRSHLMSRKLKLTTCPKCKSTIPSHQVCKTCGYYKGKDILKFDDKAKAKEERRKLRDAEEEAALKKQNTNKKENKSK